MKGSKNVDFNAEIINYSGIICEYELMPSESYLLNIVCYDI